MNCRKTLLTWFLSLFLTFSVAVGAYAYSNILAFGDSLSDNGVYGMYGDAVSYTGSSDIYGYQRFSNGPVWVEYLAKNMGVSLVDMAYGGAKTTNPYPNLGYQLANNPVSGSSSTLVTLLFGANDMSAYFGGDLFETPQYAAENVYNAIKTLAGNGFTDFFVPNLPNIGATLLYHGTAYEPYISGWCQAFNFALDGYLNALAMDPLYASANFMTFDTYSLITDMFHNPDKYGFASVNDIFWIDGYHPSTQTHLLFANAAMNAIPEPATILLVIIGLTGLVRVRRRLVH